MFLECWNENKVRFELFEGYEVSIGVVEYGIYYYRIICNIFIIILGILLINIEF